MTTLAASSPDTRTGPPARRLIYRSATGLSCLLFLGSVALTLDRLGPRYPH